ncbi:hypothetical protein GFS24_17765 [Chitinophaga sp. SYP-B3965]|uniref:hypothetical protein n=1 Tax=Chitinophaga sp. SYP-B3965 TaxID=2663120 RepID=UPI001299E1C3|nr:hypothetical protein [Chitinophaga sp. SYP-B3965]MRG46974.1 hypothetical protein [Chitinophaga sp. SYP-B3965]
MKKILFLYLLINIHQGSSAQFVSIADGPEFNEPEKGAAKIIQLKNGNTVYLHFREGINLQLYNAAHQRIQDKNIPTAHTENINAVFETQGDVVVFASERENKHPVLYRLILDGKDGTLKKEEVVLRLDQLILTNPARDFNIEKDPYSEYYAIRTWLNEELGSEIIHYGPDHAVLSRGVFDKETVGVFYHGFTDMVVLGDKAVCILASNFNVENRVELLTLEKGSSAFKATPVGEALKGAALKYNPYTSQLIVLQPGKISLLNATTKVLEQAKKISGEGIPQNILIMEDGSFRIVMEEKENYEQQPIPYAVKPPKHTILGDLTILQFDKKGTQTGNWLLRKKHGFREKSFDPFYQKHTENAATLLREGEQYLYVDMVGDQVLINEATDHHRKTVWLVTNCSGFYYTLESGNKLSKQRSVFSGEDASNLGLFIAADYDPVNKVYATLHVKTKKKNAKITWLRVE